MFNMEKKDWSEYKLFQTKQHNAKPLMGDVILGYANMNFVLRVWQLLSLQ